MKHSWKRLGAMFLSGTMSLSAIPMLTADAEGATGLGLGSDGKWYYYVNGQVASDYTGFASNEAGWWYVKSGTVDLASTGVAAYDGSNWYYRDSRVDFDYSGPVNIDGVEYTISNGRVVENVQNGLGLGSDGNWYYFENGQVASGYTGFASNEAGWWYVRNGAVDFASTGVDTYDGSRWYYRDSRVDFDYSGPVTIDGVEYTIANGRVIENTQNGLALGGDGNWYYFENGQVARNYTGFASNEAGWWYVKNGAVDFASTGVDTYDGSKWYYHESRVDFDYSGSVTIDGVEYTIANGRVVENVQNGLALAGDGNWYYFENGQVARNYTGFASNEAGWWYVKNGAVDFASTGVDTYDGSKWYYHESRVDFDYSGPVTIDGVEYTIANGRVVENAQNGLALGGDGNWYYFENGQIARNYTGFASNEAGWWYVKNGAVDFASTGVETYDGSKWYYHESRVDFDYSGPVTIDGVEYTIANGRVVENPQSVKNGLCPGGDGNWYYYVNGQVDGNFTGFVSNEAGWWYVKNGQADLNGTGVATDSTGTWYYRGGKVDFDFSGKLTFDGVEYTIVNGKVTGYTDNTGGDVQGTYQHGVKFTGKFTSGITLILSSENPEYALTVKEDPTANGGYNLVMSKLTGDESQKFWIIYNKEEDIYSFLSMKYLDDKGVSPDGKWLITAPYSGWNPNTEANVDNVGVVSANADGAGNGSWVLDEVQPGEYTMRSYRPGDEAALGYTYMAYMNVPGKVEEGANVQAGANVGTKLTFHFVSPYTKTLESGTYEIALSDNSSRALTISDSSVKDGSRLAAGQRTFGSEQLFEIECVDGQKGLYRIKNYNSQKYLNLINGSVDIGTGVEQIVWSEIANADARLWYIQARGNNTYSIISSNSNQVLTVSGDNVVQKTGTDAGDQKFVFKARVTGAKDLLPGVYSVGASNYRFSYLGEGVYSIYSLAKGGYCAVSGNDVAAVPTDTVDAAKWRITKSGDKYVVQSLANGKYLTAEGGAASSSQALELKDASASVTSYAQRYDLSTMDNLTTEKYSVVRVIRRMKALGLNRDELLDPIPQMNRIETEVANALNGLPTEVVEFTGNTVKDLNEFMQDNVGKIVRLTQDIQVKQVPLGPNTTNKDIGEIRIPSNVILDGAGYSLKQACADDELPTVGVVFRYNDMKDGYQEKVSDHCGVWNLTASIPYTGCTLETNGADYFSIKGNNFSNAEISGILISKSFGETKYGVISGNTLSAKQDALGVHGEAHMLVIEGNTVKDAGHYGVMISYLDAHELVPVEQEIGGPHDIVVKNNLVNGAGHCAMYCLGTYQVYLTGNELCNSQLEGICFDSGCIGNYFYGNKVHHTALGGGLPGVSIDNGIYNIVDNNEIYDNDCVGIKIVRAGYGSVIVNNTCANNNHGSSAGQKGNIGISIEVKGISPESADAEYVNILDVYGSDSNVVYNNTVHGGHYHAIAISEYGIDYSNNGAHQNNNNNVVKYNMVPAAIEYPTVDFSELSNTMVDNVIMK